MRTSLDTVAITGWMCFLPLFTTAIQSTTAIQGTTDTPSRFPCGKDRCVVNEYYCSKEDSPDPNNWRCLSCDEKRHWCQADITRVPSDCFGYCQTLKDRQLFEAVVANITKEHGIKEEMMFKETNHLKDKLHNLTDLHEDLKRNSIIPSGAFDRFLVKVRWFTVVVAPLALLAICLCVGYLVRKCLLGRRRLSKLDPEDPSAEPLKGGKNEDLPAPMQEMNKVTVRESHTNVSALGLKQVLETGSPDQKSRVDFAQPSDKGAHGVRVLPKGSDLVGSDGKAESDSTAFLDRETVVS